MRSPRPLALPLFLLCALLAAPAAASPATGYRLWLGDQFVDDLAARPTDGARDEELPAMLPSRRELVVVTTDELAMGSQLLWRFLDFRAAEGFEVVLATEVDWDVPTGTAQDGRAHRIRAWLADRYAGDPGAFLLLIGDPDPVDGDLPMLFTHPLEAFYDYYDDWLADEFERIPTDYFYADLDSDWDCDGDGKHAEYPDDRDCTDFTPELIVGRLPVYDGDVEALDVLLARLLAHDGETDTAYRLDTLFPAALFGIEGSPAPTGGEYPDNDDGACIVNAIHDAFPEPFQAGATRLYEDTGGVQSVYPHEGGLSRDEVVARWSEGRGMVIWAGHGGPEGVYRTYWEGDHDGDGEVSEEECAYPPFLESPDAADLADAPGAFTWHVSCDNGYPEEQDNIGAALLYGGAIATATASRPAFGVTVPWGETFEPRPDLATSSTGAWYYALKLADGHTVGEALAWTKYALPGDGWAGDGPWEDLTGAAWLTRLEYNLYGDPTRSLTLCDADADCDDGSPCNGAESCQQGVCSRQGPAVDCSWLDDDCSVGRCAAASGECVLSPRIDGTPCDDGAWCSESDSCSAGVCGGIARDCGSRDGYDISCSEELQSCAFDVIPPEPEPVGHGCSVAARPTRTPAALLTLFVTLLGARRRRDARGSRS